MKNLMSTLTGGYQGLNSNFQYHLRKSKFINLPLKSKLGFNLKGYLIRNTSWKSEEKTLFVDKLLVNSKNITLNQALDSSKMDLYLSKVGNQLYKYALKGEKEKFVKLYRFILKRSFAFRIQIITQVQPKGMRQLDYKKVRVLFRSLDGNLKFEEPFFKYKRVNIPKESDPNELRPLSVPDLLSRCIARAQYQILNCGVEGQGILDQRFFGTRRGKGAGAAWKVIMDKIIKCGYIYEFDFSKFYDTINVVNLQKSLHANDIPGELVGWVAASIAVSQESLRDETGRLEKQALYAKTNLGSIREGLNAEYCLRNGPGKYMIRLIPGLRNYLNIKMQINMTGIPQGYGLGPLLSALYVEPYTREGKDRMILYIDDGILFSKEKLDIERFKTILENIEIKLSEKKSGGIREGKYGFKGLKYLGITFDPTKAELKSKGGSGTPAYQKGKDSDAYLGMNYGRVLKDDWKLELKTGNKIIAYLYNPDAENWNAFKLNEKLKANKGSFGNSKRNGIDFKMNRSKGTRIKFTTVHSDIYGYIMFRNKL